MLERMSRVKTKKKMGRVDERLYLGQKEMGALKLF
jgi:hypothetical protein